MVERTAVNRDVVGSSPTWGARILFYSALFISGSVVKRLRHRPFTAVTRVRFPVGSPPIKYALVAELADAPDLGSGGRPWGFESLQAHQIRSIV